MTRPERRRSRGPALPPVQLLGTAPQIRAATRVAVGVVADAGNVPADLRLSLLGLNRRRRRLRSVSSAAAKAPPPAGRGASGARLWWLLVSVLAAGTAVTGLAMVPDGAGGTVPAQVTAVVAAVLALGAAIDLLRTRHGPPTRHAASVAATLLVAVSAGAGLPLLGLGASAVIGGGRTPAWWFALVVVTMAASVVVVVHVRRAGARLPVASRRRGPDPAAEAAEATRFARQTLQDAHRLARLPEDAVRRLETTTAWLAKLPALARYLPEDVYEQAASMTPMAWIVWSCYDDRRPVPERMLEPFRTA